MNAVRFVGAVAVVLMLATIPRVFAVSSQDTGEDRIADLETRVADLEAAVFPAANAAATADPARERIWFTDSGEGDGVSASFALAEGNWFYRVIASGERSRFTVTVVQLDGPNVDTIVSAGLPYEGSGSFEVVGNRHEGAYVVEFIGADRWMVEVSDWPIR